MSWARRRVDEVPMTILAVPRQLGESPACGGDQGVAGIDPFGTAPIVSPGAGSVGRSL
jgi:hypothetical protein